MYSLMKAPVLRGSRDASPPPAIQPLAACTTKSVALNAEYGPLLPNGVSDKRMRPCCARLDRLPDNPKSVAVATSNEWMTASKWDKRRERRLAPASPS